MGNSIIKIVLQGQPRLQPNGWETFGTQQQGTYGKVLPKRNCLEELLA